MMVDTTSNIDSIFDDAPADGDVAPDPVTDEVDAGTEVQAEAEAAVEPDLQSQLETERQARLDEEREAAYLRGRVDAMERGDKPAPEADPEPEGPNFWDDPEGAITRGVENNLKQLRNEEFTRRCNWSAERAAAKHDDYKETVDVRLKELLENDDALAVEVGAELHAQHDPGQWAYDFVKRYDARISAVDFDPDAEREKIRKELQAEMSGESPPRSDFPTSNAGAVGSGMGSGSKGIPDDKLLDAILR